ncbi:MAG: hypothetical protein KDD60_00490 [Bdellovibrionales bacterium]|nr:hypothetical protein [Bdellovibrionales bacterium]
MKGTLELSFPPLAESRFSPARIGESVSSRESVTDNEFFKVRPLGFTRFEISQGVTQRLAKSMFQRRVPLYCQLLKKEWWLRNQGPYWQRFQPGRMSYRLSQEWFDYYSMVRSIGSYLRQSENGRVAPAFEEVVVNAADASAIHKRSPLLSAPLIVLSDLASSSPADEWRKCEGFGSIAKVAENIGFELQFTTWNHDKASFRNQLKAASVLQPLFIRLCHGRAIGEPSLFGNVQDVPGRMRDLQLGLEAFQLLGYEPVVLHSHTVVLAKEPTDSLIEMVSLGRRSLGLGASAVSLRYDFQGRSVIQRNPNGYHSYRKHIDGLWRDRRGYSAGMYLPYLHRMIEEDLLDGEGLSYAQVEERFGVNLEEIHPGLSQVLSDAGFVERQNDRICLTDKGRTVGKKMAQNFFVSESDLQFLQ